ncbi:hypothetical protein BKA70DRAFT_357644 [Coprinopsis sp. MPI-PUGE-AT-0042]|nr:hypothetical protein BKA70DRAFT_357644 [Coprinopsis sp. MPI-PUGE-AT-0042]
MQYQGRISGTAQEMLTMAHMLDVNKGNILLQNGQAAEAKRVFWEVIKEVCPDFPLPSLSGISEGGGAAVDRVRSRFYTNLDHWKQLRLIGAFNGLGECFTRDDDLETALAWYEEVNVVYRNLYFDPDHPKPLFSWMDHTLDLPEFTLQRVTALVQSSRIFFSLGNTATAGQRYNQALDTTKHVSRSHFTQQYRALVNQGALYHHMVIRNPDPQFCHELNVTDPRLQVLGSWKKLGSSTANGKGPSARYQFASFIWDSKYYIFGGTRDQLAGPQYKDFWCLDLETKGATWRELAPYPGSLRHNAGRAIGFGFLVHREQKCAYLITGQQTVESFDLVTEEWSSFNSSFNPTPNDRKAGIKGSWIWPGNNVTDAGLAIDGDKIYVFGGKHGKSVLGNNLLMELDVNTKEWKRLSGYLYPQPDADYSCPDPRTYPSCWVGPEILNPKPWGSKDDTTSVPKRRRLYMLFGQCNREGAFYHKELHQADKSFTFNDFWSWDLEKGGWRRERIVGNPPAQRTEMACTYNEKLNKVVIFGGFTCGVPSRIEPEGAPAKEFDFTYYADTFLFDYDGVAPSSSPSSLQATSSPEDPSLETATEKLTLTETKAPSSMNEPLSLSQFAYPTWRHVLTRGFPTYRCQAALHTDQATGKVYLYGGFVNSDLVPARKTFTTRSFGDLWQLRMDIEGGDFNKVDIEEEKRTAKAGPWQRCFTCGNAGRWKRCGGKCRGAAWFCSTECQKEGWKEHKRIHKCSK